MCVCELESLWYGLQTLAISPGVVEQVGLPAAIGAKHILNGTIVRRGCIIPNTADVYNPVLYDLASEGIVLREKFHG